MQKTFRIIILIFAILQLLGFIYSLFSFVIMPVRNFIALFIIPYAIEAMIYTIISSLLMDKPRKASIVLSVINIIVTILPLDILRIGALPPRLCLMTYIPIIYSVLCLIFCVLYRKGKYPAKSEELL